MVTIEVIEYLYSRYGQATNDILSMDTKTFFEFLKKSKYAFYEERCWYKWLIEGSEENYNTYKDKFFGTRKIPNLEKALEMAREIKRREEVDK